MYKRKLSLYFFQQAKKPVIILQNKNHIKLILVKSQFSHQAKHSD